MKSLGLLFMLLNHFVAPFFPLLMGFTGEPARHFLTFHFLDPDRYRPEGYWKHARKLTLWLCFTSAAVLALDFYYELYYMVQMPLAWLILTWLRPAIFKSPLPFFITGISILTVGFSLLLVLDCHTCKYWLSGSNLIGSSMLFAYLKPRLSGKIPKAALMPLISLYIMTSFINYYIHSATQADTFLVGIPLILIAIALNPKRILPRSIERYSLALYIGSLWVACIL